MFALMLVNSLSIGLIVAAPTGDINQINLVDTLHEITRGCSSFDVLNSCTNFAIVQLSNCGPDDLTCQCNKLANIELHCNAVCENADITADATKLFFKTKCSTTNISPKTDEQVIEETTNSMSTKAFADNLATYQILEQYSFPKSPGNFAIDKIKPITTNIRDSFQHPLEKRSMNGINKSLQVHLRHPQLGLYLEPPQDYDPEYLISQNDDIKDDKTRFSQHHDQLPIKSHHQLYVDDGSEDPMELHPIDSFETNAKLIKEKPAIQDDSRSEYSSDRYKDAWLKTEKQVDTDPKPSGNKDRDEVPLKTSYDTEVPKTSEDRPMNILERVRSHLNLYAVLNKTSPANVSSVAKTKTPNQTRNYGSKPNAHDAYILVTIMFVSLML